MCTDEFVSTRLHMTFVLAGRGLFGGVRMVVAHGNRLLQRGHRVTVVCLRRPWPHRPKAFLRRLNREIRAVGGLDRDHLDDFEGRLLFTDPNDLSKTVPDGDVVIATHWLTANRIAQLPEAKGAKCYFIQGYEIHAFEASEIEATWRLPMRKLVVSSWLRDRIVETVGDAQVVVVPNGIEPHQFDAPPRELRRPPTAGLTYSPVPVKGTGVAFEAIRLARRKLQGLRVVGYGAGRPTREVPILKDMQYRSRPSRDRLRSIYASADVWLCASEREGFALPPLEAMACRCPVVVTRCGGPTEFVEDGVNGFFVDVSDADAMAERMVAILSDAEHWKHMSNAAYETSRNFSMERSSSLFEQALLDETCATRSPGKGMKAEIADVG